MAAFASPAHAQFGQFGTDEGELRQLAESGDKEGQFQLGLRMAIGEGVKKNPAEGAKWLEKAAGQGHLKAMHVLGALYEEGAGVPKNEATAAKWYQKAADGDFAEAKFSLALLYQNGRGVAKDPQKATELAKEAAADGHLPSQALYASKLVNGDGVDKNPSKGALWFLKAAKKDHPYAQRQLAYLYYTGNGVPVDYERCLAWYRRAVQVSQDPWAKNDLAWFLATCPDPKFQRGEEAMEVAKNAVMSLEVEAGEQRHEIIDTMAAALARNGKFAEAMVWQKRCLKLLDDDKDMLPEERAKLKAEFDERLGLYKAQKAYSDKVVAPTSESEPLYNDTILQDGNSSETPDKLFPPQRGRGDEQPRKKKENAA